MITLQQRFTLLFTVVGIWFVSYIANAGELNTLETRQVSTQEIASNKSLSNDTNQSQSKKIIQKRESDTATKKPRYRIGISHLNEFPLITTKTKSDKGFAWTILERFAKEEGITFQYIGMPINHLQPALDRGAIDFIFPDNPKWTEYRSNRNTNHYSARIISALSSTFVAKQRTNMRINQVKELAIPYGYTAFTWLPHVNTYNISVTPQKDLVSALIAVQRGQVDAADVEYNVGKYLVKTMPRLNNVTLNRSLPHIHVDYHLSTIKHINILAKIDEFLQRNKEFIKEQKEHYDIKYHTEVFHDESN